MLVSFFWEFATLESPARQSFCSLVTATHGRSADIYRGCKRGDEGGGRSPVTSARCVMAQFLVNHLGDTDWISKLLVPWGYATQCIAEANVQPHNRLPRNRADTPPLHPDLTFSLRHSEMMTGMRIPPFFLPCQQTTGSGDVNPCRDWLSSWLRFK